MPVGFTLSFDLRDSARMTALCTFGTLKRDSPEPHPFLVPARYGGRLRVLLLRQAFAVPLRTSIADILLPLTRLSCPAGFVNRFYYILINA